MMNSMTNCQTAKLVTKSMTEATIQSQINDMASGKVTRTIEGKASGVMIAMSDPLYQFISLS